MILAQAMCYKTPWTKKVPDTNAIKLRKLAEEHHFFRAPRNAVLPRF